MFSPISFFLIQIIIVVVVDCQLTDSGFNLKQSSSTSRCFRTVPQCVSLRTTQCLDVTLPYSYTYPSLTTISSNQSLSSSTIIIEQELDEIEHLAKIRYYLEQWKGLRAIPRCWKALQSVLCSTFFPRCDPSMSRISLPTNEMCRLFRQPCRAIDQYYRWPSFLRCDNQSSFPSKCPNEYIDFKFNISHTNRCHHPLVSTDDKNSWYGDIDGCALRCDENPLYTSEQHQSVSKMIKFVSAVAILFTGFVVLTFIIDKPNRIEPNQNVRSSMVFWINLCLLISYLSWWLPQLIGRFEIVCRWDNTVRYGVQAGHTLCVISFFILYYFSMSAMIWFVLFAYSNILVHRTNRATDRQKILLPKQTLFHMIAWVVPFIMTLIIWLIGEIDGDSLYGMCFVGIANHGWWVVFVLIPITIGFVSVLIMIGKFFNQLSDLYRITSKDTGNLKRAKVCRQIRNMFYRFAFIFTGIIVGYIGSITVYYYQRSLTKQYSEQLHDWIFCNMNITNTLEMKTDIGIVVDNFENNDSETTIIDQYGDAGMVVNRCDPLRVQSSMIPIRAQILLLFSTSIIAAALIATMNTYAIWKRYLEKRFNSEFYQREKARKRHERDMDHVDGGDDYKYHQNNGHHDSNRRGGNNGRNQTNKQWNHQQNDQQTTAFVADSSSPTAAAAAAAAGNAIPNGTNNFGQFCVSPYPSIYTSRPLDPAEMDLTSITSHSVPTFPMISRPNQQSTNQSNGTMINDQLSQVSVVSDFTNSNSTSQMHSIESNSFLSISSADRHHHHHQRRNNKGHRNKDRKMIRNGNFRRRGSDSSMGSLISSAYAHRNNSNNNNRRPISSANGMKSTSTSTGDLRSTLSTNPNLVPPPFVVQPLQPKPTIVPIVAPIRGQIGKPLTNPTVNGFHSFGHQVNFAQFTTTNNNQSANQQILAPRAGIVSVQPTRLPCDLRLNSFTFTHGMIDQNQSGNSDNQLINPMIEKRRPDSRKSMEQQQSNEQQQQQVPQLSSNQIITRQQQTEPTLPLNLHPMIRSMPNRIPNINAWVNMDIAAVPYHQMQAAALTPEDYNALLNERTQYSHLITPRADSSSSGQFLPIYLSDSEYWSDGSRRSMLTSAMEKSMVDQTRREVDERMLRLFDNNNSNKCNNQQQHSNDQPQTLATSNGKKKKMIKSKKDKLNKKNSK